VNELHVRWEAIPPDVREILCWSPVLDRYRDLARECPEWRPPHEYESLERAWQLRLPGLARMCAPCFASGVPSRSDRFWSSGSKYAVVRTLGLVDPESGFDAAQHALATAFTSVNASPTCW
jgi:hypothetical protein